MAAVWTKWCPVGDLLVYSGVQVEQRFIVVIYLNFFFSYYDFHFDFGFSPRNYDLPASEMQISK